MLLTRSLRPFMGFKRQRVVSLLGVDQHVTSRTPTTDFVERRKLDAGQIGGSVKRRRLILGWGGSFLTSGPGVACTGGYPDSRHHQPRNEVQSSACTCSSFSLGIRILCSSVMGSIEAKVTW